MQSTAHRTIVLLADELRVSPAVLEAPPLLLRIYHPALYVPLLMPYAGHATTGVDMPKGC